jgi:hypothetical protein
MADVIACITMQHVYFIAATAGWFVFESAVLLLPPSVLKALGGRGGNAQRRAQSLVVSLTHAVVACLLVASAQSRGAYDGTTLPAGAASAVAALQLFSGSFFAWDCIVVVADGWDAAFTAHAFAALLACLLSHCAPFTTEALIMEASTIPLYVRKLVRRAPAAPPSAVWAADVAFLVAFLGVRWVYVPYRMVTAWWPALSDAATLDWRAALTFKALLLVSSALNLSWGLQLLGHVVAPPYGT